MGAIAEKSDCAIAEFHSRRMPGFDPLSSKRKREYLSKEKILQDRGITTIDGPAGDSRAVRGRSEFKEGRPADICRPVWKVPIRVACGILDACDRREIVIGAANELDVRERRRLVR